MTHLLSRPRRRLLAARKALRDGLTTLVVYTVASIVTAVWVSWMAGALIIDLLRTPQ